MSNLLVEPTYINLGEAAINAVMGFAVVFLGISVLILVVWLFGKIFAKLNSTKRQAPIEEPKEVTVLPEDDELTAVISVAIAAYYEEKNRKPEFVVKNFKRN